MSKITIVKLIPFWIFILLFQFGGNIHYTFLPALGDRLAQTWIIGIIIGLLAFIQLILDVPAGFLLDRFGYIKMLRLGTIIFIISALILAFVPGLLGFILVTITSALGWLFLSPGVNAYILSIAPKEKAERFIVFRDSFTAAGITLGSLTLSLTVNSSPFFVGLISAIFLSIALFFVCISPKDTISVHEEIKVEHHHYYIRRNIFKKILRSMHKLNPASWMLIAQGISSSIFYGVVWFVVPIMIADPTKKIFGISLGIFDFSIIILGFFLGKLVQRIKEKISILIGLLVFSLAGIIIGKQIEWTFLLFGFLATSGEELSNIALWWWLAKLDTNHETDGEVSSVISFFQDLGWTIGPMIAGVLYGIFGGELTISLGALPILITFLMSLILIIKHGHLINFDNLLHQYPRKIRGKK